MKFKIVVPMYNVEQWVRGTVTSVLMQSYENFECVFVDDCSTDNTVSIVESMIEGDSRCSIIKNESRKLALYNIYHGFEYLNCDDEDVLTTLDGDDWFDGNQVLETLKEAYENTGCWLTYGNYTEYPSGRYNPLSDFPSSVIEENSFRDYRWVSSALRTYKYKLWKNIKKEDLLNSEGDFYQMAWDVAFMLPMLEMAGDKIHHLEKSVYIYNRANPINDNKVNVDLQLSLEREIRSKPRYSRLLENTTV